MSKLYHTPGNFTDSTTIYYTKLMPAHRFTSIDEYIQTFPTKIQAILTKVRKTIHSTIPTATETISYQIPTFKLNGRYLIYFAGWKDHISVYPIPNGPPEFEEEISQFKAGKGTLRFALDKPIPYELIKKIVKLRIEENADSK